MVTTLAERLKPVAVDWKILHKMYNPLLSLVKELLGVVPNCDPILEIWPPGFNAYNLLVPNMFNLPATLFGSKSFKKAMGLAMWASSKAACAYCTAHACSFALRRGLDADVIMGRRTEKEHAIIALAEGLGHTPSTLTIEDVERIQHYFSPEQTEWLVFAVSMMGFLNKFMNAVGVELEQEAVNDTAALLLKTGWEPGIHAHNGFGITKSVPPKKDNLFTYARVIRHAPGAVLWERKSTKGVPSGYPLAGEYLRERTGCSFFILKPIRERRVVRTLTAVLRDNLDKKQSVTGLKIKMFAGYIFSSLVSNSSLISEIKCLAVRLAPELNEEKYKLLDEIAKMQLPTDRTGCDKITALLQQQFSLTEKEAVGVLLTKGAAYSPSQINDAILDLAMEHVQPGSIVELLVWLSVLQLLNRLSSYYMLTKVY